MSVFTRERADKYVWRLASISHTLFGALGLKLQGGNGKVKGEPDTGCGSSNDLFHFIKFMWEFLQFIYLFVLGSITVQVPYKYNFCRAVSVSPSSSLQPLKGVILFWKNMHLIRRKILFLTEKQSWQGSLRVEILREEIVVPLTWLQASHHLWVWLWAVGLFTVWLDAGLLD